MRFSRLQFQLIALDLRTIFNALRQPALKTLRRGTPYLHIFFAHIQAWYARRDIYNIELAALTMPLCPTVEHALLSRHRFSSPKRPLGDPRWHEVITVAPDYVCRTNDATLLLSSACFVYNVSLSLLLPGLQHTAIVPVLFKPVYTAVISWLMCPNVPRLANWWE